MEDLNANEVLAQLILQVLVLVIPALGGYLALLLRRYVMKANERMEREIGADRADEIRDLIYVVTNSKIGRRTREEIEEAYDDFLDVALDEAQRILNDRGWQRINLDTLRTMFEASFNDALRGEPVVVAEGYLDK